MLDSLVAQTNLPNLHPALVHFPIVILLLAFLIDLVAFISPSREWLRKTAVLLWVLGAIGAGITFWSGRQAAETVQVFSDAEGTLTKHENFALYSLWFLGMYAGIRIVFHFLNYRRLIHLLILMLAIPGQALLFQTADLGGGLVYKYGIGVKQREKPKQLSSPQSEEEGEPVIEGNNISWVFAPGSELHFTSFLKLKSGSISDVQVSTERKNSKTSLVLSKSNSEPVIFTFDPILDDTQIEVEVDLTEFNGQFGLIHHFQDQQYDYFVIDRATAVLGRKAAKGDEIFSKKQVSTTSGPFIAKAVGANTHFRGYVNGKLFVHGHDEAAAPGKAGILLIGIGKVALAHINVSAISGNDQ